MMTINRSFQHFLESLELREKERDEASRQHRYLREALQNKMSVEDNFISGSYARSTALRPLNDIDIFLVLKQTEKLSPSASPETILREVKAVLEVIYPGKTARLQSRSVNIEFSGTNIAYDVVPAFSDREDVYLIPDRDEPTWIETNPKVHKELSTDANRRADNKLKPLVKAVKHANNVHKGGARSFHLEVLSWRILTSPPKTFLAGLRTLLDGLAAEVCVPCPEPAGLGPDIRPSDARCRKAQSWLGEMAKLAREAESLADDGRTSEAHVQLHDLFGKEWPEEGSSKRHSTGGAVVIGGSAVDDSRSRFG